jgi:hypothetical protein
MDLKPHSATYYVIVDKSLSTFVPQFPHLENGGNNTSQGCCWKENSKDLLTYQAISLGL